MIFYLIQRNFSWLNIISFSLLIALSISNQAIKSYKQYNYTLQKPVIKQINVSQKSSQEVEQYYGDILSEFLIKEPIKTIGNIIQVQVTMQGNTNQQNYKNKNIPILVPQIDGIIFQTYSWPLNKVSHNYFLNKNNNQSLNFVSIISATYEKTIKSSNHFSHQSLHLPTIYTLLSDGLIQKIENIKYQSLKFANQYVYMKNQNNINDELFNWKNAYLYQSNGHLYMLIDQIFYKVNLQNISNSQNIYKLQKIENIEKTQKVIQFRNRNTFGLYVLTEKGCFKIQNENEISIHIDFKDVLDVFNITSLNIVDYSTFQDNLYLLDAKLGIIKFSQKEGYTLLQIQKPQYSKIISVYGDKILIGYQINEVSYVEEYIIDTFSNVFYASKFYSHYQQVQNIVMFKNYFFINRGFDVISAYHSFSSSYLLNFHRLTQNLQSTSIFTEEIVQLRPVLLSNIALQSQDPYYMIVNPQTIQLIKFNKLYQQSSKYQQKWVKISSQNTGIFNFNIKYLGECPESQQRYNYCSLNKKIQLVIKDIIQETSRQWMVWVFGAVGILIFLILIFIFLKKHFVKKQAQLEDLLNSKPKKNNEIKVQMTQENIKETQFTDQKNN